MCTVSYIALNEKIVITSNRDEQPYRSKTILQESKRICYPKDPEKGGTWFVVRSDGTLIVLLNGALEKHIAKANYRKSRGLIVLELIQHQDPLELVKKIDLNNIEPFTLVMYGENELLEVKWDGVQKHLCPLDITDSYIWSSVTLYDAAERKRKQQVFKDAEQKLLTEESIISFHQQKGEDKENGFFIQRPDGIKTISTTQVVITPAESKINHMDLENNKSYVKVLINE